MSRTYIHDFLTRRDKDITPEREGLIAAVMNEGRRMSARTVLLHAAIAERLGLNPSDHKCADLIVNETGPITAGRLAEITGLSTGAITGVVDRLERAGFVSRVHDAEDRRRVLIKGIEKRTPDMQHLFLPMVEGMATLCDQYTNEQLELIRGFMLGCGTVSESVIERMRQVGPEAAGTAETTEETPQKSRTKPTAKAQASTK